MPRLAAGLFLLVGCSATAGQPAQSYWFSEEAAWTSSLAHGQESGHETYELLRECAYAPPHRSPRSLAILSQASYEAFDLRLKMASTHEPYGHLDLCLVFGFQDPAHYYYVHLAPQPDEHAHNIFIVNDAPRTRLADVSAAGVEWGLDVWHDVRVQRTEDGTVRVWFDDMATPVLEARDDTLMRGHVGFGSFDDTGRFFDLTVEGPALPPLLDANPFGD